MNSDGVMRALVHHLGWRRQLLVPRVSWGLVDWGECDLLALSDAGYLTEFEIKVSNADIRREWKKDRWVKTWFRDRFYGLVRRYYMVVPHKIMPVAIDTMPDFVGGGVIVVDHPSSIPGIRSTRLKCVRAAHTNTAAGKLTDSERMQMARLGAMRYWGEFMARTKP